MFLDKLDHASIVDGAKMSYGNTVRFNHGDLAGLERKLAQCAEPGGRMVIVDGVYSMEGDIADLPGLLKVCRRYGAALAVDDAHSIGVLGPNGDGTAAHFGLTDEVDIVAGTFSKSLASIGGFVAASRQVINYLRHHSRPLIFTAALPPGQHGRGARGGRSDPDRARAARSSSGSIPAGWPKDSGTWASRPDRPRRRSFRS